MYCPVLYVLYMLCVLCCAVLCAVLSCAELSRPGAVLYVCMCCMYCPVLYVLYVFMLYVLCVLYCCVFTGLGSVGSPSTPLSPSKAGSDECAAFSVDSRHCSSACAGWSRPKRHLHTKVLAQQDNGARGDPRTRKMVGGGRVAGRVVVGASEWCGFLFEWTGRRN